MGWSAKVLEWRSEDNFADFFLSTSWVSLSWLAVNSLLDEPSCPLPYSKLLSEHCTLSFLLAAALRNLLQAAEMVQLLEARLKTKKREASHTT